MWLHLNCKNKLHYHLFAGIIMGRPSLPGSNRSVQIADCCSTVDAARPRSLWIDYRAHGWPWVEWVFLDCFPICSF